MSTTVASSAPATVPSVATEPTAAETLRKHGRTFHFAGKILGKQTFDACARLYCFCRIVDDIADQSDDPELARLGLNTVLRGIGTGWSDDPRVRDLLDLCQDYRLDRQLASELVKGVRGDLEVVRIKDDAELKRYCYRVAGTVGLMMCGVLGVRDLRAFPHAIDLGIAMQLTNIARDVAEDARDGRCYLPADSLGNVSVTDIADGSSAVRDDLKRAVRNLLAEAESYYRSGEAGLAFLPLRSRLAILVAARAYRAIGTVIAERGFDLWQGRAIVTRQRKQSIALRAAADFVRSPKLWRRPQAHHRQLHQHLGDLPCVRPPDSPSTSPSR